MKAETVTIKAIGEMHDHGMWKTFGDKLEGLTWIVSHPVGAKLEDKDGNVYMHINEEMLWCMLGSAVDVKRDEMQKVLDLMEEVRTGREKAGL